MSEKKLSGEELSEKINIACFFSLQNKHTKPTIIDEAIDAEQSQCWLVALDLYLAFWLWVESLPKKYKKVNYVFRMKDYM